MDSNQGDSMKDSLLKMDHTTSEKGAGSFVTPLTAFHPEIGLVKVGTDSAQPDPS